MRSSPSPLTTPSGSERTPSFVCEVPLRVTPAQARILNTRLNAARQLYNACLSEALKRARLLQERRAYQQAQRMPQGKERTEAFRTVRQSMAFTDAALQRYAVRVRQHAFREHLDVHVAQKLASRAFAAVHAWLLGQRGRPRFKGSRQLDTVEGKSNHAGICWRDDRVEWRGLSLPASLDPRDPVIAHALASRVKYVRLVRRKGGGRDRFYAQLVCEGVPYRKPQHAIGDGEVGLDIGPSTIAVVGAQAAWLEPFCAAVIRKHRAIRRRQRKLDRQRRANNPEHFLPDGRVKPGPKRWVKSARQRRTEQELADLFRREAAHRKTLHGQLAHRVLAIGRVIKTEKLSYHAMQRQYGRSVGVRAPGLFLAILRRKAASAGGRVIEFPTRPTKLSQVCHGCGRVQKKPLSQRIHACACGVEMQRDLYSAFLAWCVGEDHRLHAGLAHERWPGAEPLLRAAWSAATQPARGRTWRPSAFGAPPRSQSGSPAQEGTAQAEAPDGVAVAPAAGESRGEVAVVPLRTPRL
ncbi:MAG: RNA-guided endonuclease TnpB family protein [Firmicutes bacterium]|nr:RNA-guided endonuclease TnpB family protein [Bacillota bacterium]